MGTMNLRSLRITTYLAPIALTVACGSSASNGEQVSPQADQDSSTPTSSSSGSGSSGNGSSSGSDTQPTSGLNCAQDSDCTGECDGSAVCCCDTGSTNTCYSPASGQCGGDDAGTDDDAGNSSSSGGGFPI
jgi:hypothetical protein